MPLTRFDNRPLAESEFDRADFSKLDIGHFCPVKCRFLSCSFAKSHIRNACFGGGPHATLYQDCDFTGLRFRSMACGRARFERCRFEDVRVGIWICMNAEFVDCTFSGHLKTTIFSALDPNVLILPKEERLKHRPNEFRGNDFTRCTYLDVTFRGGIDLSLQRLPDDAKHGVIQDAALAIPRLRSAIASWKDPELRGNAHRILGGLLEEVRDGQEAVFVSTTGFAKSNEPAIRAMLALYRGTLHP